MRHAMTAPINLLVSDFLFNSGFVNNQQIETVLALKISVGRVFYFLVRGAMYKAFFFQRCRVILAVFLAVSEFFLFYDMINQNT